MATLNIGGKRVKVDDSFLSLSPEQQQATVNEIAGSLGISAPAPEPQTAAPGKGDRERSMGETLADVGMSAGQGLMNGVIGLAGLPADLGRGLGGLVTRGVDMAMGVPAEESARRRQMVEQTNMSPLAAPSSADITRAVERVTGPRYQPQTMPGEYARTIGEFAPSAALGPGGAIRKAAMTAVPAVASETAGQMTKDTAAEPFARLGGALVGGMATMGRTGGALKEMRKNAPAQAEVAAQSSAIYNALDNAGVRFDSDSFVAMLQRASDKLRTYRATKAPLTADSIENLKGYAGKSPSFRDVEDIHQDISSILRERSASDADKSAARILLKEFDDFYQNAATVSNGSIDPARLNPMIKQARELARRNILAKQIGNMEEARVGYLAGDESGMRNQFASYLRSNKRKGLTDVESKSFQKVVRREGPLNVAHAAGSRLGQIGTMVAGLASAPVTGPLGVVLGGAGILGNIGARKGLDVYTRSAVNDALRTVLAGRDAQARAAALEKVLKGNKRLRGLLSAEAGIQSTHEPFLTDARGTSYAYPLLGQ